MYMQVLTSTYVCVFVCVRACLPMCMCEKREKEEKRRAEHPGIRTKQFQISFTAQTNLKCNYSKGRGRLIWLGVGKR